MGNLHKESHNYIFTIDAAIEIASLNKKHGRSVRKYLISVEKEFVRQQLEISTDYLQRYDRQAKAQIANAVTEYERVLVANRLAADHIDTNGNIIRATKAQENTTETEEEAIDESAIGDKVHSDV